jgi:hypothetical protein
MPPPPSKEEALEKFRAEAEGKSAELDQPAFVAFVTKLIPDDGTGTTPTSEDLIAVFALADGDGNGVVSEDEFGILWDLILSGKVNGLGQMTDRRNSLVNALSASDLIIKLARVSQRASGQLRDNSLK